MDFPRYKPKRERPPGAGAFSDYAAAVEKRQTDALKSSRVSRPWGKKAAAAQTAPPAQPPEGTPEDTPT